VKAYLKLREGAPRADLALCGRIIDHCRERLAAFKVPRYIAFIEGDFARTAARKIIKRELVKDVPDLRAGAFDRVDEIWR
jgi:long-chain acyl-CoA synthetase